MRKKKIQLLGLIEKNCLIFAYKEFKTCFESSFVKILYIFTKIVKDKLAWQKNFCNQIFLIVASFIKRFCF